MPYIQPEDYTATPAFDLLAAGVEGFIGFDQRLIHALVDHPERTRADIVRFAASASYSDDFEPDLVAIFRYLNTPEAIPFYLSAIRKNVEEIPDDLTEAVTALGAPALEPLLELYHDIGEEQGGDVGFILAGLGLRDQRILEILLERLEYDAGEGALSLSLYGDPAAIPHIQRVLDEVPQGDAFLRHELHGAIQQIKESVTDPAVAPEPFDIFELYPEEAGPNFDLLSEEQRLSLLSDTPAPIRAEAVASFKYGTLSPKARDRLLELGQSDSDANVRGRAWESLADAARDPAIHSLLMTAAASAPLEERSGAVVALASASEPDEQLPGLIEALYTEPDARAKAVEAMWKSLDPRFRDHVVRHLDDPDPLVRHHAIYGVGYLGVGSEAPRLISLFEDEDFRPDALLAYALSAPTEISRGRMKPLLRRIEDLAGGLSGPEQELVEDALDQRLAMHGLPPVFDVEPEEEAPPKPAAKVGRNDPCPCGSGRKYKKCHGA